MLYLLGNRGMFNISSEYFLGVVYHPHGDDFLVRGAGFYADYEGSNILIHKLDNEVKLSDKMIRQIMEYCMSIAKESLENPSSVHLINFFIIIDKFVFSQVNDVNKVNVPTTKSGTIYKDDISSIICDKTGITIQTTGKLRLIAEDIFVRNIEERS